MSIGRGDRFAVAWRFAVVAAFVSCAASDDTTANGATLPPEGRESTGGEAAGQAAVGASGGGTTAEPTSESATQPDGAPVPLSADGGTEGGPPTEPLDESAGCPIGDPQPAAGQTLVIVKLNLDRGLATLRNTSAQQQVLSADAQLCQEPFCVFVSDDPVALAPSQELEVDMSTFGILALSFFPAGGEVSLHDAFDVADPATLRAYVAWGTGGSGGPEGTGKESDAVAAGFWEQGERITIEAGHAGFVATGPSQRSEGYASAPDSCF